MTGVALAFEIGALACVAAAALADVRHFEIPDGWSIAVVLLFAGFAVVGGPLPDGWLHVVAGVATFVGGTLLFARGWLGGGDVKLLAACALWTGFDGLPWLIAGTTLSGAVLAMVFLIVRSAVPAHTAYSGFQVGGPLPYALAILGGAGLFAATAT